MLSGDADAKENLQRKQILLDELQIVLLFDIAILIVILKISTLS